jgi:hypothetical protein
MVEDDSYVPTPPELAGEAAPEKYGVRTGDGNPTNPSLAIFPIVRFKPDGKMDLLGTGFFVCTNGLFVTARHVLSAPFDAKGQQRFPIAMLHFYGENMYLVRPILRCAMHPVADVAVGVAAPMKRNSDGEPLTNPILTLTTAPPDIQTRVVTYAYPRYANLEIEEQQKFNMLPRYYDGQIAESLPDGRDRVLLPGPCYRTSIILHHGASGGPVFCPTGAAFAVNSTGFDGTEVSYVSRIDEIFDLVIDDVVIDKQPAHSVRVIDMAHVGHIVVNPPLRAIAPLS